MIPQDLVDLLTREYLKSDLASQKPESGGCLNQVFQLQTRTGKKALVKFNRFDTPQAFRLEAEALDLIRKTQTFYTPEVLAQGRQEGTDYLLMEYIEKGPPAPHYWRRFGESLAKLHLNTQPEYGWKEDNYIGPLTQRNTPSRSWVDFFIQCRIEPPLKKAVDNKKMNEGMVRKFDRLFAKLEQYLPEEKPALLHGDLWSGNVLTGAQGLPVLIDPALYYGHREIELAYTQLFDRYDPEFYQAYQEVFPMLQGFEERVPLHQLYPLLIHVNLFGGGYVNQVEEILKFYV